MMLTTVIAKVAGWTKSLGGKIAGLIGLMTSVFVLGIRWSSNRQKQARLKAKVKEIRELMEIEETHNAKTDEEIADDFINRHTPDGD